MTPRELTRQEMAMADGLCRAQCDADPDVTRPCITCREYVRRLVDGPVSVPPEAAREPWRKRTKVQDALNAIIESAGHPQFEHALPEALHNLCDLVAASQGEAEREERVTHGATYNPAMGEWCAFCGVYLGKFDRGGHLCAARSAGEGTPRASTAMLDAAHDTFLKHADIAPYLEALPRIRWALESALNAALLEGAQHTQEKR